MLQVSYLQGLVSQLQKDVYKSTKLCVKKFITGFSLIQKKKKNTYHRTFKMFLCTDQNPFVCENTELSYCREYQQLNMFQNFVHLCVLCVDCHTVYGNVGKQWIPSHRPLLHKYLPYDREAELTKVNNAMCVSTNIGQY